MNWDQIKGNWKQFSGQAKQQWGKLTDDDLAVVDGKREELAGRIQERYGCAKDEAEKQIKKSKNPASASHPSRWRAHFDHLMLDATRNKQPSAVKHCSLTKYCCFTDKDRSVRVGPCLLPCGLLLGPSDNFR